MSNKLTTLLAIATIGLASCQEPKTHDHTQKTYSLPAQPKITRPLTTHLDYSDWTNKQLTQTLEEKIQQTATHTGYSPEQIYELYQTTDANHNALFDQGDFPTLLTYLRSDGTPQFIKELATIRDAKNQPLVTNENVSEYLQKITRHNLHITTEQICQTATLTDSTNNAYFHTAHNLLEAAQYSLTQKEITAFEKRNFDAGQIITAHKQQLSLDKYPSEKYGMRALLLDVLNRKETHNQKDTHKPNARYIVAKTDHNRAFQTPQAKSFLKNLDTIYDLEIYAASTEQEVYNALENLQETDLLVLAGHGSPVSIALDETQTTETHYIDISDKELGPLLSQLPTQSTIYLQSCSNGYQREHNNANLANTIHQLAPHTNLISVDNPFAISQVLIDNPHPLRLALFPSLNGERIYHIPANTQPYKTPLLQTQNPVRLLKENGIE